MREIEFKLFLKGKHVGYERHIKKKNTFVTIQHAKNYGCWSKIHLDDSVDENYDFFIKHDEKRQWTNRLDKNGEMIYEWDNIKAFGLIFRIIWHDDRWSLYTINSWKKHGEKRDIVLNLNMVDDDEMEVIDE